MGGSGSRQQPKGPLEDGGAPGNPGFVQLGFRQNVARQPGGEDGEIEGDTDDRQKQRGDVDGANADRT